MGTPHKSDKLRSLLLEKGRSYNLPKGQVVQTTDGRKVINLLESGYIKRYLISNQGGLGIQVVYGPGDIFPITLAFKALLNEDIYEGQEVYYYETINACKIYTLDDDTLAEYVNSDPTLYKDLLSVAGKRLHYTLQGLENLTLKTSYKRVAHQLAYFARQFGKQKSPKKIEILLPLTHQDLADTLSVTRETVSVSITQLREKGLIENNKHIIVPNIQKLEDEAYN